MSMRLVLIGLTIALATSACRQTTAPARQVSVVMEANPAVVQRGDTVTFVVNATANNLFGVVIDYGDSSGDQFSTGGASTARVTFKHVYTTSGSYTARATVTDALVGEKEVTHVVVVN